MKQYLMDELIRLAFKEDIGEGDHTSLAIIPSSLRGRAKLILKENGIVAGVEVAKYIFKTFDPKLKVQVYIKDGEKVQFGEVAFLVEGDFRSLLQVERIILNVMQRMSGIATITRKYVKRLVGTNTILLDTRKTTPGIRVLEKEAVRIGGGKNHRMGLFDMILLKDNHIDFAGGIKAAIISVNEYLLIKKINLQIEVEVRNLKELKEVLQIGRVNRILLDNFTLEQTRQAVREVKGRYLVESSGNITYDNVRDYAEAGVDYVSVGALTHSVKSFDMSFKAILK